MDKNDKKNKKELKREERKGHPRYRANRNFNIYELQSEIRGLGGDGIHQSGGYMKEKKEGDKDE